MKSFCIIFLFCMFLLSHIAEAQKFAVHFKDKNGTPYDLDHPDAFLSQRSLERRKKFNIPLSYDDLPVNPDYIKQIEAEGATILFSSNWINCALVCCSNDIATNINNLPYVDSIVFIYPHNKKNIPSKKEKQSAKTQNISLNLKKSNSIYGNAFNQINQINGITVHEKGYEGNGILIAVLDGGFCNTNTINAFNHLYETNRLLMAKDFIEPNGDIYHNNISGHGTSVLSCMAAYLPNLMVGAAPKASYCLFRTEDTSSEYLIEEYTWVIGAEVADSIGADLINSSLSYTKYDDPSMSHQYSDMDGKTTIASIGARKAIERGIFICVSAGNEGNNSSWPWIGTPADVTETLTVGAVDYAGQYVSFSSIGPNAAGSEKPNIMAQGSDVTIIIPDGTISKGDGTSYSSPIACGMVACLLQAYPYNTPKKLKEIIEKSSTLYETPSYKMGYGIPDFYSALQTLPIHEKTKCNNITVYPNPSDGILSVKSEYRLNKAICYDITGRLVAEYHPKYPDYFIDTQMLSPGIYIIRVYDNKGMIGCAKFIKE